MGTFNNCNKYKTNTHKHKRKKEDWGGDEVAEREGGKVGGKGVRTENK
jgi:hypothetical protein